MSECGCVYSNVDDGDLAEFVTTKMLRARKPHVCGECRGPIAPGERYERNAGKWDGQFSTFRTCAACVEIRQNLFCDGRWVYGCVWEDIREAWRQGNRVQGCINALETVVAKEKLAAAWRATMRVEPL